MKKRFSTFSRKHNHLFVFAGVFIVFFTFVIKDGLAEHWNHVAETIDTAEYMYSIQANIGKLQKSVRGVKSNIDFQDKAAQGMWPMSSVATVDLMAYDDLMEEIDSDLTSLEILANLLPKKDVNRREVESFRRDWNSASSELKSIKKTWIRMTGDTSLDHEKTTNTIMGLETSFGSSISNLAANIDTLIRKTLSDAREHKERNARYADYAWWISAALFTLGSALGLVGKLYGVPDEASGD